MGWAGNYQVNHTLFRPISCSGNSKPYSDTIFVYQQKGGFLKSTYYGGNSIERHLSGLVADDGAINMSYHEINKNCELMTGILQV